MPERKGFRKSFGCSADVTDWIHLNRMADNKAVHYLGNHRDDENAAVYAVFEKENRYYCIRITE